MAKRILFISATRLGDAVLGTGVLAQALARWPGARVTLVCGPAAAPLFAGLPELETCLVLRKGRGLARHAHWADVLAHGWGRLWDAVIDLRGSASAYVLPTRTRRVWRGGAADQHRVAALAGLIDPADTAPPAPRLWLTDAHRAAATAALGADPRPLLALGPTANWRGKIWPADRFADLAAALTGPGGRLAGAHVVVAGGPGERDLAAPLLARLEPARTLDLVGTLDLLSLAAVLGRARLFIGNDSGLMHLAAAAGTPTLGLFGPSRPALYGPWGAATAQVRTDEDFETLMPPGAPVDPTRCLMTGLPVARVVAAAENLLASGRVPVDAAAE